MTNDPSKNRDRREVPETALTSKSPDDPDARTFIESNDYLGFVADIQDSGHDLDGVAGEDPVDLQIKPHTNGYQVDMWWTDTESGKRRSTTAHIHPEDPRDRMTFEDE